MKHFPHASPAHSANSGLHLRAFHQYEHEQFALTTGLIDESPRSTNSFRAA